MAKSNGSTTVAMPRLLSLYRSDAVPVLTREFGYTNPLELPNLEKIIVNIGLGEAIDNSNAIDAATGDLATITGQKPIVNRAKKSIANFKLREGMPVGASVTLRSHRMWQFYDRLVNVVLPRVRDFRGTSRNSFRWQRQLQHGADRAGCVP